MLNIVASTAGDLGEPIGVLPNGQPIIDSRTQIFEKNEYAFQIIEKLAFGIVKLSIVFLYRRIFVGETFNAVSWGVVAIISAWSLSFFLATVCECKSTPSTAWSPNRKAQLTQCVKTIRLLLAFAWSDVATDVLILSLPIPQVLKLQLPLKEKVALLGIFLLGVITVLAGIARLIFYYRAAADHTGPDVAINTAPTFYWSLVEASLAVVSACLPTIRPLFQGFSPESVIRSIRSRISLQSMGSKNSKGSKGSRRGTNIKPTEDQKSTSSQVGFAGNKDTFHEGSPYDGDYMGHVQTEVEGTEMGHLPKAHIDGVPDDRIRVLKTVEQNDENV